MPNTQLPIVVLHTPFHATVEVLVVTVGVVVTLGLVVPAVGGLLAVGVVVGVVLAVGVVVGVVLAVGVLLKLLLEFVWLGEFVSFELFVRFLDTMLVVKTIFE